MSDSENGFKGTQGPNSGAGKYNELQFIIAQALGRVRTVQLVRVEAVTNDGGLEPVGFVDVVPMVHQLDGQDQPVPHGTIYGIPYSRMQGGENAIIIDPQVGDIGICMFADRDLSTVKASREPAAPGSKRQFSMSDGLYIGGVLNGVPTQFIRFYDGGIEIVSPDSVTVTTPNVTVNADYAQLNGNLGVSGNVTVGNGASGTFTTREGLTVTIQDGIVMNIF